MTNFHFDSSISANSNWHRYNRLQSLSALKVGTLLMCAFIKSNRIFLTITTVNYATA